MWVLLHKTFYRSKNSGCLDMSFYYGRVNVKIISDFILIRLFTKPKFQTDFSE